MNYTQGNFPELQSKPDLFMTWTLRIFLFFTIVLVAALFLLLPFLVYNDGKLQAGELVWMTLFCYGIVAIVLIFLVKKYRKARTSAVKHIYVDDKGIHYERRDGQIESILYRALHAAPKRGQEDVFVKKVGIGRNARNYLAVHYKQKETVVYFDKVDLMFSYYVKNQGALMRHFLQGVRLFRPQLSIAGSIYSEFYIKKDSFEYDKKSHRKTIAFVVVFMIIIFLCIELYIHYRWGHSLFSG